MEAELIAQYIAGKPWMIGVILFSLSLVAFVRFTYGRVQSLYFKSLFSSSLPSDFINEEKVLSHRASLILLINSGIFASLLILVFSENYFPSLFGPINFGVFMLVFMVLAVIFLIKTLLQTGFRIIFEEDYGIKEYILNNSFVNMLLGMVLIPVSLMVLFMSKQHHPVLFKLTIGILLGVQIFKIFKGSLIAIKYRVNILYFILYLCCFEIIPVLVVLKEVFFNAR